jgi:ABC-type multidrug transport system fused ATPase/permease subunit
MYDIWEKKQYKKKNNGLFKTILRANLCGLLATLSLSLLMVSLEFTLIFIFREIVKMMDPKYVSKFNIPFMYVVITYCVIRLINIMLNRHYSNFQNYLGFKSYTDLNCFIYSKVLKASPSSIKQKSKEGDIINFMQFDSMKLSFLMILSPGLFVIPIQITVYSYMLFVFFGLSFLFGFGCLFLSFVINFFIQKRFQKLSKETLKAKDKRMKVTTETFNNLKVLKLYSWEDEYLKRINTHREDEINCFNNVYVNSVFSMTLLWSTPVLVSVVSIGAYQYFVDQLKIEDIFSCIGIFNSIQEPIRSLPAAINSLIECLISLKRIEV